MTRFLEDELIRLRAVEPADAKLMWDIENDSTQWRDNGMAAPYSRRNLDEYAANYDADPIRAGQVRFVAQFAEPSAGKETEQDVFGLVDLYDISPINRTAFVGIYIVPAMRNRGLGKRSLELLEDYARRLLNIRILAAKVAATNSSSRHLFENAGYKCEGQLTDWLLSGKETRTLLLFTKKL